jgi:beta-galactosidase/beta-glucuronidase
LKSTHTGNHVPFGQVVPTSGYPDLLRRDLLYAKASGFNMVRYISGLAYPDELNMCDELGLLVYEETLAAWLLADSPKMKERYQSCVREMILRDRNHPSVVIWGMLNETKDGPVFREAVSALPLMRSLDETRLVLLSSGRFDGHLSVGSVSNPGSSEWEPTWGEKAPGAPIVEMKYPSGVRHRRDFHLYPNVPQTPEVNHMLRTLGQNSKPVFLSEYGMGSMMNLIHEVRMYQQAGIPEGAEDFMQMRSMADRLTADWSCFAMETAYPYPETLLEMSQRSLPGHGRFDQPAPIKERLPALPPPGGPGEPRWARLPAALL